MNNNKINHDIKLHDKNKNNIKINENNYTIIYVLYKHDNNVTVYDIK